MLSEMSKSAKSYLELEFQQFAARVASGFATGLNGLGFLKAKTQDLVFDKKNSSLIEASYLRHKTR